MAIEHSITFGGVNSADFGIYISGEGVFNAPERDVETVEIPGRNGEFILDKGRFKNIEVTYPAFNYEEEYDDFVQNLSDFRNAIASQIGYQRLSDTFHPEEYRMGAFVGGLEIDPIKYNTASEFELVFNCKPQRYLTDGETAISVDSGDVVSNPTLFEASPLLEVKGEGVIDWGKGPIVVHNELIGPVVVHTASEYEVSGSTYSWTIDDQFANAGDTLSLGQCYYYAVIKPSPSSATLSNVSHSSTGSVSAVVTSSSSHIGIRAYTDGLTFSYGTAHTETATISGTCTVAGYGAQTFSLQISITYDGDNGFSYSISTTLSANLATNASVSKIHDADVILDSTQTVLGNPIYIDLDIGEAYKIENGSTVSVNNGVEIPTKLPTLAPGANTVTFDNTITELKVIPRWWKI